MSCFKKGSPTLLERTWSEQQSLVWQLCGLGFLSVDSLPDKVHLQDRDDSYFGEQCEPYGRQY